MGYLGGDGGLGVLNTNELTGGWLRGCGAWLRADWGCANARMAGGMRAN
jgi:hypothetical protein